MGFSLRTFLVVLLLAFSSAPVVALPKCPEGRTASGACVNAPLAGAARQGTIVLTQPKLSYTGRPTLPNQDRKYDVLRDRRLRYEIFGPGGF
jgi:hypothetical protein